MNLRATSIFASVLLSFLFTSGHLEAESSSEWKINGSMQPGYQSNVFKAPPDYDLNNDQIWDMGLQAHYRYNLSDQFTVRLRPRFDAELYSKYSQRNQAKAGGDVRFEFVPSDIWTFRLDAGTDRANRDLVNDAGETTGRTLAKWTHEFSPEVRFDLHRLRIDLQYRHQLVDYDEAFDSTGRRMKSYDYDRDIAEIGFRYRVLHLLEIGVRHEREWRDYTERVTLSLDKKSSEIRSFKEHTSDIDAAVRLRGIRPSIGYRFTRRTDNFENFYGYDYSRVEVGMEIRRMWQSKFQFSFIYAEKEYPNYWTSRIGNAHRVAIEYRDWRFDWEHPLTRLVDLVAGLRWYIKTSNDRNFRYRQLTTIIGARLSFGS